MRVAAAANTSASLESMMNNMEEDKGQIRIENGRRRSWKISYLLNCKIS
jgi:hypothetical protein